MALLVLCAIQGLMFLGVMGDWDHDASQRLIAAVIGLGLGAFYAAWLLQLQKAKAEGALATREEAGFKWLARKPRGFGLLTWVVLMLVCMAVVVLLGGIPVLERLVLVTWLMAILPHEIACWFRATGPERQGRQHTVWLLAISALSAAFYFPPGLAARSVGAGAVLELAFLAICHVKSKTMPKA